MREVIMDFKMEAYLVGVLVAVLLPVIAMVAPVVNSLSIQLRDALDIFRSKTSSISV